MITWPAMIKYAVDDELTYIADLAEWHADADLHFFEYHPLDIFIDATGLIHQLNNSEGNFMLPHATGELIDLELAIAMLKAHFSSLGSCCAAKLTARSVAELIALVAIVN